MKATTGLLAGFAVTLALMAGTASAHPGHGHGKHHEDRPRHGAHWKAPKRGKRMPDWLYYKPHFRRWYRHSEVKYWRELTWRQVYRIYKRQVASRYYRHHRRGHDYYYGDDWSDDRSHQGNRRDGDRPRHRRRG